MITQTLPAGLTFISAVPAPDKILANQVVWDLGEIMASPESQEINITLQLASNVAYGSQITATYEISGASPEPEQVNNTGLLMVWTGKHIYLPVIRR